MKNLQLLLLTLCLWLVAALPTQAQTKDIVKVPISEAKSYRKKALIIGINNYRKPTPSLVACVDDARNFYQFLHANWGFEFTQMTLLTDDQVADNQPNYTAMVGAMDAFVQSVQPGDEVVFFYSGHGTVLPDNNQDYLVPSDAYLPSIAHTCINYNNFRTSLQARLPQRMLLVTDACRNLFDKTKANSQGSGFNGLRDNNFSPESARSSFAEIRSCSLSEFSLEMPGQKSGLFTYYLIKGLAGDLNAREGSDVTFDSLMDYLVGNVGGFAASQMRSKQTPSGLTSNGKMVISSFPDADAPKPLPVVIPPVAKPPVAKPPVVKPPIVIAPPATFPPILVTPVENPPFSGSVLRVSARGVGNYRLLGDAVRAATAGTRILVESGFYAEPINIVIDKPLEIIGPGVGANPAIIQCASGTTLFVETERALVRGLTLRCTAPATKKGARSAVSVSQGRLLLESCDLSSTSGSGLSISGTADPLVRNCRIHDNKGVGVFVYGSAKGTLENCDLFFNTLYGIQIVDGANPTLRGCRLRQNKQSGASVQQNGRCMLENCDIISNEGAGVIISSGGNPTILNCRINSNEYQAISASADALGTVTDCNLTGNRRGVAVNPDRSLVKYSDNEGQ